MHAEDAWLASLQQIESALQQALQQHTPTLGLRAEQPADSAELCALYVEFRWSELAHVPWPDDAKQAFLIDQFQLQSSHYRKHYQCARFWVVTLADVVIGRLYLHRSPSEFRLMDIMLFQRVRGLGYGRVLIDTLLEQCRQLRLRVSLHVERENPAKDFYERRGFVLEEDRDTYLFMTWQPAAAEALLPSGA